MLFRQDDHMLLSFQRGKLLLLNVHTRAQTHTHNEPEPMIQVKTEIMGKHKRSYRLVC